MARTRNSPRKNIQCTRTPVDADVPLVATSTRKGAAKNAPKSKRSREANDVAVVEAEQPMPAKKATVGRPKRQRDDAATVESGLLAPTKRARTTPSNPKKDPKPPQPQSPVWRSNRTRIQTSAVTQRKKRRTKDEVAADKAKADAEKKQQEELTEENHRAMEQMDINEDIARSETAARTIRTFGDLERDSETDGEEFVGFDDISGGEDSDSDSDSHAKDAVNLKVRYPS